MLTFVVQPARAFWRFGVASTDARPGLLANFVFMVLHNFRQSDFLEGDDPAVRSFSSVLG
jgi:hypothetical protein